MGSLKDFNLEDGVYAVDIDGKVILSGGRNFVFEGKASITEFIEEAAPVVPVVIQEAAPVETVAVPQSPLQPSGFEDYRRFVLNVPRNGAGGMGNAVSATLIIKHAATGQWVAHRRNDVAANETVVKFADLSIDKNYPVGDYIALVKIGNEEIYRKKITVKPPAATQEQFTDEQVKAFNPRNPDPGIEPLVFWDFGKRGNVKTTADLSAHFIHGPRWGDHIHPKFNNEEWQNFQTFDMGNHLLVDDHLKLIAKAPGGARKDGITSAALRSKLSFLPDEDGALFMGVRCKLPAGKGLWPAWWLYPAPGHPRGKAELDMFEVVNTKNETAPGWKPLVWHSNTHANAHPPHLQKGGIHKESAPLCEGYHTWIAKWTMEKISLYFDGELRRVIRYPVGDEREGWGAARDAQMLINLAAGGGWPGEADDAASFPAEFCVDWMGFWRVA